MTKLRRGRWAVMSMLAAGALLMASPALSQQTPAKQAPAKSGTTPAAKNGAAATPAQEPPAPPLTWTSRCASDGRKAALQCEVEQSMFITRTGQLVATMTVKIAPDTQQPVMMLQLPVGMFLPGGVNLQVDEKKFAPLVFQTCDLKGCYAATTLALDMLDAMRTGKQFTVSFQNLSKEAVNLAFSLAGFADNYDKVK